MTDRISIKIEPELHKWFSEVCKKNRTNMSTILREFVRLLYSLHEEDGNYSEK